MLVNAICFCNQPHQFMKGSMFLRNTLRPLGLLPLLYLQSTAGYSGVLVRLHAFDTAQREMLNTF